MRRKRQLESEIAPRIEHDLPGVEVLAVELANPERFVVYVDHPEGSTTSSACASPTFCATTCASTPSTSRRRASSGRCASRVISRARSAPRSRCARSTPLNGRSKFKGELKDAGTDAVTLVVDGDEVDIPYEAIVRGNLIDER